MNDVVFFSIPDQNNSEYNYIQALYTQIWNEDGFKHQLPAFCVNVYGSYGMVGGSIDDDVCCRKDDVVRRSSPTTDR